MKVVHASRKVQEARLSWYGHKMRHDEEYVGHRMLEMGVVGQ